MTEHIEITFTIPREFTITSNMRLQHYAKASRVKSLRILAKVEARGLIGPEPCRIIAHLGFPDKRRRDPNNWADTTKALIDGMVEAGVFTDDNHSIIQGPDHRISPARSERGHITVTLTTHETEVQHGH